MTSIRTACIPAGAIDARATNEPSIPIAMQTKNRLFLIIISLMASLMAISSQAQEVTQAQIGLTPKPNTPALCILRLLQTNQAIVLNAEWNWCR